MAAPPDTEDRSSGVTRVLAVLTAAAGLSALVAFTGAAIVWVRFSEAKLPAEQAVAATPNEALLAVGGAAIGAFALIAALAVLIVYLVDSQGTRAKQSALIIVLAGTGVALATLFVDASSSDHLMAVAVSVIATLAAAALAAIALDARGKDWVCAHKWRLLIAGDVAVVAVAIFLVAALGELLATAALLVVAAVLTGLLALAFTPGKGHELAGHAGAAIRFLAAPAALGLIALVLYLLLNQWWIAVLVVLAAALAVAVLTVAHRTRTKFAWYGTAVFVAVVIFGAAMHGLRTLEGPRLQPMALLFTAEDGGAGQWGLFVSDTSDRVHLGLVQRCHRDLRDLVLRPGAIIDGSGEIVGVPRSRIAAEAVGTMASVNTALQRAPQLLDQLTKRFAPAQARTPLPVNPCADEGVLDQKVRVTTPVPAATAATLAERFRPLLRFDSRERWRPLDVDQLLTEAIDDKPAQRLCDGVKEDALHCTPITVPAQISAQPNSPGAYVDLQGQTFGGADYRSPFLLVACTKNPPLLQDCDSGPGSAIYYHAVAANGRYYIDYWWFLRYNRFEKGGASELCRSILTRSKQCFDHEGDWEGVTAVASQSDPTRLAFVDYAAHEGVFRYTPAQIGHVGTRPIVYIARGSHAAYPVKCPRGCKQVAKLFGHALPEDNTDGEKPWGRNSHDACNEQPSCLQPLPTGSWGAFAGFWGSRTCHDGRGGCRYGVPPRSPSRQHRYQSPWCYSGVGLGLVCDGRPPPA